MTKACPAHQMVLSFLFMLTMSYTPLYAQPSQVVGNIKGLANKPVMFSYLQKGSYKIDTVSATNDRFTYTPKPSDDGRIQIRISRPRYTSFWYEPGLVTVSGSVNKPYQLIFKGGPENNVLNQYQQSIEWPYESQRKNAPDSTKAVLVEQERKVTIAFIKQHLSTRTSAHLLYWQTVFDESFIDEYENIFTRLPLSIKESYQGKEVAQRIRVLRNQPVVGKLAPNFTLDDTSGHAISLAAYRGKYVLLDFWGHWCSPCIKSFPQLKQLHKAYEDRLVIFGIAAEHAADKSQWMRIIKVNNLNWIQVSELKADKGDVNTQYNVTAFPTYLLLNKQGLVIARALDLEVIRQKIISLPDL